jgi:hypothetical protein
MQSNPGITNIPLDHCVPRIHQNIQESLGILIWVSSGNQVSCGMEIIDDFLTLEVLFEEGECRLGQDSLLQLKLPH